MEDERENVLEDRQQEDPKSESAEDKHEKISPILLTHGAAPPA